MPRRSRMALGSIISSISAWPPRHVVPESQGFEPDEVLDLGKQLGDVAMFAAPTMVRRLVDAAKKRGETRRGLRTIVYGGGPMYLADIRDAIADHGAALRADLRPG